MSGRRRRPSRRTLRPRVLVVVAVTAAAMLAHVAVRLQSRQLGYEIAAVRAAAMQLAHENRKLEAELATLTSVAHVDRVARHRLGLRAPAAGQVVGMP